MPQLGCIADDLTGATDVANMLAKSGMHTELVVGVPSSPLTNSCDAVVVALKSRNIAPAIARAQSAAAADELIAAGCRQIYFKYCSTFDSTAQGNIGPVADMLIEKTSASLVVVCPAFPANGRTVYKGYLFVGDIPLNESSMRDHPLTPMRDSSLVRILAARTSRRVGLASLETVRLGPHGLKTRFRQLADDGCSYVIVDAIDDADLRIIGKSCADMPLVTGGSGLALCLAPNFKHEKSADVAGTSDAFLGTGFRAVVAGSCSSATLKQIEVMQRVQPAYRIEPQELAEGRDVIQTALTWAASGLPRGPIIIYASADPASVLRTQTALGRDHAGQMIESAIAQIAKGLVHLGVRQLIVAGGETAGAVVRELGVKALRIGPEIDPGVPWTAACISEIQGATPLHLALKSGNFGGEDFFLKAWSKLA